MTDESSESLEVSDPWGAGFTAGTSTQLGDLQITYHRGPGDVVVDPEIRIPTSEKLAGALRDAGAPEYLVLAARAGVYDDYRSASPTPKLDLYHLCLRHHLKDMADRVQAGEFDAQGWETDLWTDNDGSMRTSSPFHTAW
jgi:hypothetical protein